MKKGIIYSVIESRKVTMFIVFFLSVFGLFNYYVTPKQEAPTIELPVAIITAIYPGASPNDMEKLVTRKIEEKVAEMTGYVYSRTYSKNSIANIVFELENSVDRDEAWSELREKIDEVQAEIPEGSFIYDINTEILKTTGFILSVTSDRYDYEMLEDVASDLKDELLRLSGISKIDIKGERVKKILVEPRMKELSFYSLTLDDIVNLIKVSNITLPLGEINYEDKKINIKSKGEYESIEEIGDTIIRVSTETGEVIKLKDVAKIECTYDSTDFITKYNGKNSILLAGYFKEDKNIVLVGKDIDDSLSKFNEEIPNGVFVDRVLYQPTDVDKSVSNFILNLILGIILLIIVASLNMGIKNAIIVATAIPVTIMITFIAINILGIQFHSVSITALIISLGMIVDNAIVIIEAIKTRLDSGEERMASCINGTKDVSIPVLSATITTIVAFIPLAMINSAVGDYIFSLPVIIISALVFSYIVAIFVIPTMAYIFLEKRELEEKDSRLKKIFMFLLDKAQNRKYITGLVVLCLLFATFLAFNNLGLQFFPKSDKNMIYVDMTAEVSADIGKTEELSESVRNILFEQEEVIVVTEGIGDGIPKFWDTMWPINKSVDLAQILVKLDLKKGGRFKSNAEFVEYVQKIIDNRIINGTAIIKELEQGQPVGAPVTVRVSGKSMDKLPEIAYDIEQELKKIEGAVNVRNDFTQSIYEYDLRFKNDVASSLGITKYDIQNVISTALEGRKSSTFRTDDDEYDILVRGHIKSKEELENIFIRSTITNEKVLLKQVADIDLKESLPEIKRYKQEYSVQVLSDVLGGYSSVDIQNELKAIVDKKNYLDVEIDFAGEQESINDNFSDLGLMGMFAVAAIFTILLIQFKSFLQPFIILLTIPMSIIGAIFGLFITNLPLSFTAVLGIVSLFGIVVNDTIVMIEFINRERELGVGVREACKGAVDKRYSPIMLTTVTTVCGLIPLVFLGSDLFTPMAVTIIGGLLVATFLTLVVVPVVYTGFESINSKFKNIIKVK